VTDREPLPIPRELALRLATLLAQVAVRLGQLREQNERVKPAT